MTRKSLITALVAGVLMASGLAAHAVDGNRLRVIDGDTVAFGTEHIRLLDIDAPEISHPRCEAEARLGLQAKARLKALLAGQDVAITRDGRDRYGRTLARLTVGGRSLGTVLVAEGLAVAWEPGPAAYRARLQHWCGRAPLTYGDEK